MSSMNEDAFNRIFLKSFFKEILQAKEPYPVDTLDDMGRILADLFLNEFNSGATPLQIIRNHDDIEEWLQEKIENFG